MKVLVQVDAPYLIGKAILITQSKLAAHRRRLSAFDGACLAGISRRSTECTTDMAVVIDLNIVQVGTCTDGVYEIARRGSCILVDRSEAMTASLNSQ